MAHLQAFEDNSQEKLGLLTEENAILREMVVLMSKELAEKDAKIKGSKSKVKRSLEKYHQILAEEYEEHFGKIIQEMSTAYETRNDAMLKQMGIIVDKLNETNRENDSLLMLLSRREENEKVLPIKDDHSKVLNSSNLDLQQRKELWDKFQAQIDLEKSRNQYQKFSEGREKRIATKIRSNPELGSRKKDDLDLETLRKVNEDFLQRFLAKKKSQEDLNYNLAASLKAQIVEQLQNRPNEVSSSLSRLSFEDEMIIEEIDVLPSLKNPRNSISEPALIMPQ